MEQRTGPRRGRPGHDQETVLRRAIELFNRQGYDGTSMGDLARELGLTKSAIYHHVPSKEALLQAALDEALGRALGRHRRGAPRRLPRTTAYDRLRTAVRRSVEVLVAPPAGGDAAVAGAGQQRGRAGRAASPPRDRRPAGGTGAEAVDEGSLRSDVSPDLVSRLLFGMVNSLVEWHRPDGEVDAGEIADTITTMAFDGLALDGRP